VLDSKAHQELTPGFLMLSNITAFMSGYPFVFFASMCVLQFFVVLFLYPETKGITLEEMQKKLGIA
jgi:MFS transporter, SP family, arabinose:H+ symporter